eukprot:11109520-Prorocentrum_lima.AAC.1
MPCVHGSTPVDHNGISRAVCQGIHNDVIEVSQYELQKFKSIWASYVEDQARVGVTRDNDNA